MTQQSEDLTIVNSTNGSRSYHFEAPLLERYELANEPYMEFRRGVEVITFNDSTQMIESTLVSNYAIFYEERELWEAKGDVVVTNAKGEELYTQQLFWDQKSQRIYSNVDSKVIQGEDTMYGEGFESDETFTNFVFRRPKGRVTVDMEPTAADSLDRAEVDSLDVVEVDSLNVADSLDRVSPSELENIETIQDNKE